MRGVGGIIDLICLSDLVFGTGDMGTWGHGREWRIEYGALERGAWNRGYHYL